MAFMVKRAPTIGQKMRLEASYQLWILARQYISSNCDWLHYFVQVNSGT